MQPMWPHQTQAVDGVLAAIGGGNRRVLLTVPTGGGKTRIASELIRLWLGQGLRTILYTNRVMLLEQLSAVLTAADLPHGVRAAGWEDEQDPSNLLQISMTQTEASKVLKRKSGDLFAAQRVIVDEAHLQTGPRMAEILVRHLDDPTAAVVGMTATPIGMKDYYETLVAAGTTGELRRCGALVIANHYGPDEPDWVEYKRLKKKLPAEGEDFSAAQSTSLIMRPGVFGRVLDHFQRLNPDSRPAILFAPGVEQSLWFAEQFVKAGVTAAHVDGDDVWINGSFYSASREARAEVLEGSRNGTIVVLCNRYVLREGIDAPWLAHGIFATVFGSLQSYLQSGGRLLRSHDNLKSVCVQDHGGNYHRHGSLNADREWNLDWSAHLIAARRADRIREKREPEPWVCRVCHLVNVGRECQCGYYLRLRSRAVVQSDGTMTELRGDIYRPRRVSQRPDGPAKWRQMYHRSRTAKGARTFHAAMALFAAENDWGWPDPRWPLMPVDPDDQYRLVGDVPVERLTS